MASMESEEENIENLKLTIASVTVWAFIFSILTFFTILIQLRVTCRQLYMRAQIHNDILNTLRNGLKPRMLPDSFLEELCQLISVNIELLKADQDIFYKEALENELRLITLPNSTLTLARRKLLRSLSFNPNASTGTLQSRSRVGEVDLEMDMKDLKSKEKRDNEAETELGSQFLNNLIEKSKRKENKSAVTELKTELFNWLPPSQAGNVQQPQTTIGAVQQQQTALGAAPTAMGVMQAATVIATPPPIPGQEVDLRPPVDGAVVSIVLGPR